MKKYILAFSAFILVLFSSCRQVVQNNTDSEQETTKEVAHSNTEPKKASTDIEEGEHRNRYTGDDGFTTGINVNLDEGGKWVANRETSTGVAKMLGIINDFTPNPTMEDYKAIYTKLSTEYQSIIQKCTMTGSGLKELQNYLLPLKEKINTLSVGDIDACNKVLPDIKDYLLKYSHFFF